MFLATVNILTHINVKPSSVSSKDIRKENHTHTHTHTAVIMLVV